MKRTGTAELRLHLSHYLKRVRAGERIIVTDHGEPIAEVIPYQRERSNDERSAHIAYLAGRGLVSLPKAPLATSASPVAPRRTRSATPAADAVARDREESR